MSDIRERIIRAIANSGTVVYLDEQKKIAEKLIAELRRKGYDAVTQVVPATAFYPAEDYHQHYMDKHPGIYDCHVRVKRFDTPDKP